MVSSYWCIVPTCCSTRTRTPHKIFINVPVKPKLRQLWIQAAGRNPEEFSKNSVLFVCEDHFDLQEDMENYLEWKMVGVRKIMRKGVLPHNLVPAMPDFQR